MRNSPAGKNRPEATTRRTAALRADSSHRAHATRRHASMRRVASMTALAVGFTLLLLYTHYLSPADFGTLVLLYVTMRLLDTLVLQGLTAAVVRAHAIDFKDNVQSQRDAVSTAFYYSTGSALLIFGALTVLAGPVSHQLFGAGGWADLLQLMLLAGLLRATQNIPRALLRARADRRPYDTLKLLEFVLAAGLNVYFVAFAGLGLTGIVYSEVLREALFALVFAFQLRGVLVRRFAVDTLGRLLGRGLPRLRRSLGFVALSTCDRYFLQAYAGAGPLGLYAFGYRLAELCGDCAVRPLLRVWPAVRDHAGGGGGNDEQALLGRLFTYFLAGAGAACLLVCVFATPLLRLLAQPLFLDSVRVVPLLLLAVFLSGAYRFLLLGPQARKRASAFARLVEGAAVLNLFLNAVLVPAHSMMGAATATVVSHGALVLGAWWIDRRHFRIRCEPGRLLRVAAALGITFLIWRLVVPENLIGQIAAGCAVLLFYPALLGLVGFYTLDELEKLRELFNSKVSLRPPTPQAASPEPDPAPVPSAWREPGPAPPTAPRPILAEVGSLPAKPAAPARTGAKPPRR